MKNQGINSNNLINDGHLGGYMAGGDPATWCPRLWSWLAHKFNIKSMIDVGCGQGYAVRYFDSLGIKAKGIEGSQEAIASSVIKSAIVQHDFCQHAYMSDKPTDFIWSCEFLEHIDEKHLNNVLATLLSSMNIIVITHAFPGQEGHHHVNCQPTIYWISLLRHIGFRFSLKYTLMARYITMRDHCKMNHFGRSGLVFFAPLNRGYDLTSEALDKIVYAGKNPDNVCKTYGLILKLQNIILRAFRKFGLFNIKDKIYN